VTDRPYLPDVGVLAFVPDEWESPWQPRHQVLARLARYFQVLWVTPPSWWREQLWNRSTRGKDHRNYGPPPSAGFSIFRPPAWLPEVGRPELLARWTIHERLRRARRMLEELGCQKTIVYIWRPSFGTAASLVPHDLSCYHIDDEYSFSAVATPPDPLETQLISRVDQVFIHSPALLKKKGGLNPNTAFVPNGVDYDAFATPRSEPPDLAAIPRPRIGYVGRIKEQLDLELVRTLVHRHANWSFVLVGPVENLGPHRDVIRELSELPNVHLLGPKPVGELPAYAQHLDVCMLCYHVNDYTKFIYPLKLHEYLATGRPVVGSPIDSLLGFTDVVHLARTADEWSQALNECLNDSASRPSEVERRRQIAQQHDWNRLVATIAATMAHRLGEPHRTRLQRQTTGMPTRLEQGSRP
jgi:glycosyltransferase involved in cell wall biosynthesis